MVSLIIDGLRVEVPEGTTLLEAARHYGFAIPTLCHAEGLSPYGACRLCVVELDEGRRSPLVASCTYPALEGLVVRTGSARVVWARRMIVELLLASCPQSRVIQDLADAHGVGRPRFRKEREQCVLCGLCVRVCAEQMQARALGFRGRGRARSVGTPFDRRSELCHTCGACLSVCPAADLRVAAPEPEESLQDRCAALPQPCIAQRGAKELHCHLDPCVACEIVRDA